MFKFGSSSGSEEKKPIQQTVSQTPEKKYTENQPVASNRNATTNSTPMETNNNIIGKETEIEGNIKSKGQMQIHGLVTGTIHAEDKLIISDNGKVDGDIFCKDIELAGQINGNVKARGKVTIMPTAHVKGDVRYYDIEIESGAHIACTISRMNPKDDSNDFEATPLKKMKKVEQSDLQDVAQPSELKMNATVNK